MNTETEVCQNCHKDFLIESRDFDFYKRINVPPPTWCPWCRMLRRMAFWNERNFFKKKDVGGKTLLSTYPEESYFKIIDRDEWWSDKFEGLDYGQDYDFSRPFFEQLKDLASQAPFPSRSVINAVNSDYVDSSVGVKNCYMCFNVIGCEDSGYVLFALGDKDCFDLYSALKCESSYELSTVGNNYKLFFGADSQDCKESFFLYDCENCTDCFGCVGLRHKQYYIWNVPHSKEEYLKKVQEFDTGSYKFMDKQRQEFDKAVLRFPIPRMHGSKNTPPFSGETVIESKNATDCFKVEGAENIRYCQNVVFGVKDSYDFTNWGNNAELVYESADCRESIYDLKFCVGCSSGSRNLEYCINCVSSEDCFGCVGLKKKKYCIFNKQYSKEEYHSLRKKIIEQMNAMPYKDKEGRTYAYGEFFPADMAPFAANESAITDWTDETKERLTAYGFIWRDINPAEYKTTINAADLPDHINDAPEHIINEIIGCLKCKRAYRIIQKEFEFLKRFRLPLPRNCPNCRLQERLKMRPVPRLYLRHCECAGGTSENKVYKNKASHSHNGNACPNKFETAYDPKSSRIVYCLDCYHKEVA